MNNEPLLRQLKMEARIMETKKFQRNKEDFICEKCGLEVEGNGYTNHCIARAVFGASMSM